VAASEGQWGGGCAHADPCGVVRGASSVESACLHCT
jgi:hypothetical protein